MFYVPFSQTTQVSWAVVLDIKILHATHIEVLLTLVPCDPVSKSTGWCASRQYYTNDTLKASRPSKNLTSDLSSSRVKDTLGHTSTPAFSVDSELLRYFPGHADAFQIWLHGVYPVLSWSSRLSLSSSTAHIQVYTLSWQSVGLHSQNVPEPSQSPLFYDEIYLLQCLRPDHLVTDFVFQ